MNSKGWWKSQAGIKTVNKVLVAAMGLFMIGMAIAGTIMTLEEPLIGVDWGYMLMPVYATRGWWSSSPWTGPLDSPSSWPG